MAERIRKRLARILTVIAVSFRLCMLEIFSNITRSILSTLGIFLGTASLLVNMTFLRGMDADIKQTMTEIGGLTLVTIKTIDAQSKEEVLAFGRSQGLYLSEAYELKRRVPAIVAVLPQADLRWAHLEAGGRHFGGNVMAIGPDHLSTYNYEIGEGRGFAGEDFNGRSKVCLIGSMTAQRLFDTPSDAVGRTVSFRGIPFTVVGLLYTKNEFDQRSRQVLIPFPTYQTLFAGQNTKVTQIAVRIDKPENITRAARDIETQLQLLHRGVKDFELDINLDKIKEMETAALGVQVLLASIAAISLGVGSISVMNIMFSTIGDRIREIGLRKALGAQRIDVFMQFLIESVLLSLLGGIPGILVGSLMTWLPEGTFPMFTPQLAAADYAVTFSFVLIAGVASGLFPAMRAANMEPIEALRY